MLMNRRKLMLTAIGCGLLLNPLNTTLISVAFSRIQEDFGLNITDITWLIACFYITSAVCYPIMGKLADIYGRKKIFLIGLSLAAGSSVLAPFSTGFEWLVLFRILQAMGTSALFPSGMGILRANITDYQARAMGVLSIFTNTTAAFGPFIGGVLIHYTDWQAVFVVNIPVIIISFVLIVKVIPMDIVVPREGKLQIDLLGMILFGTLLFIWVLFLLSLSNGVNLWLLLLSLAGSWVFFYIELHHPQPFVDVKFLKSHMNVTIIYLQFMMVNVTFYSIIFGIPLYLQNAGGYNAKETGLMMLSLAGWAVLITPFTARMIDRLGFKPPLIMGSCLAIAGTLLLLWVVEDTAFIGLFIILSIIGLSSGMSNLSLQTGLYQLIDEKNTGIASGLFMTSRVLGTILSSGLLGIVFSHTITSSQLHLMSIVCSIIALGILILAIKIPNRSNS